MDEKNESLQDNQQIYNSVDVKKKRITAGIINKFILPWTRETNHCRDTQQICNSVEDKNESLQGYSTNLHFCGREIRINVAKLNIFLTFYGGWPPYCPHFEPSTSNLYVSTLFISNTFKYQLPIYARRLTDGLSSSRLPAQIIYAFVTSLKCTNLFLCVPSNSTEFQNLHLAIIMSNID